MTWLELLDEYDVFFEAVSNLSEPEHDQLQGVLGRFFKDEVPQQVVRDLSEIQKELEVLATKKDELLKKVCRAVMKGVSEVGATENG